MKLFELNGVKRFANMTSDQVLQYIRRNLGDGPIKVLGNGHHGVAILVGSNVYKFWMQDSAYQDFVQFAMHNQNNPFLPKFLSGIKSMPAFFYRSAKAPDSINYVKMERLTPVPEYYSFKFNMEPGTPEQSKWGTMNLQNFLSAMQHMDREMLHETAVEEICDMLRKEFGYQYKPEHIPQALVQLMEAIRGLVDLVLERKHTFDLHSDNLMLRGNQLVILDPLYSEADAELNGAFQDFNFEIEDGYDPPGKPAATTRRTANKKPA